MMECQDCDGDGYQERLDSDLHYSSWICEMCNGEGKVPEV